MRSSYKKIGSFVRQVNVRNKDLSVTNLQGININKFFMPSVANTNGTDLSKYKIVAQKQFAFNPMHVGRDEVLPISMLEEEDSVIVSPAYVVFKVKDESKLLSEYLMMWCCRPEFDRNAWFTTDSSVRGGFSWKDFCDLTLPVPTIEKQREIVREYHTIVNRIKLNKRLNQKLEETAQAIYKQWFVDFEFPISKKHAVEIGKPELEGKPYKSSGGKMIWNDELNQEIPEGWEESALTGISKNIICGKTPSTIDKSNYGDSIPFITIPDMHNNVFIQKTARYLSSKGANSQKNKTLPLNAICVSCIASPGLVSITTTESQTNQQINSIICKDSISFYYAYFALTDLGVKIKEWGIKGSVGSNINKTEFSEMLLLKPAQDISRNFQYLVTPLFEKMKLFQKEVYSLLELQNTLLSKMTKAEATV